MTVNELVSLSLKDIGVLGQGQTATGPQANDALTSLNLLIEAWSLDRLLTHRIQRQTWTIASGTADYTVGSGGTIDIQRPSTMNYQGCNVTFIDTSANPEIEIPLWPMTDDGYQAIPQKPLSATYPTGWYYNPTYTSSAAPYGTLTLWPVPNVDTLTGVFYAPVAATTVALADTLALPPGYARFYRWNLAEELLSGYAVPDAVAQRVMRNASTSRADVEKVNTRLSDLGVDLALVPGRRNSNVYIGS